MAPKVAVTVDEPAELSAPQGDIGPISAAERSALLEGTLASLTRRMTEAEYLDWADEHIWAEWRDGEATIEVAESIEHLDLVGFLTTVLSLFVRRRQLGRVTGSQFRARIGSGAWRLPDVLFVATNRLANLRSTQLEAAPDLAIEVVSKRSVRRDWREKFLAYEAAGVREYWIVDPLYRIVNVNVLGDDGHYRSEMVTEGPIRATIVADFWLNTEWLWQTPPPDPIEALKELGVL